MKKTDKFGMFIRDALRNEASQLHVPDDFADRLTQGLRQPRLKTSRGVKVAAGIAALLSFSGFAAWMGMALARSGGGPEQVIEPATRVNHVAKPIELAAVPVTAPAPVVGVTLAADMPTAPVVVCAGWEEKVSLDVAAGEEVTAAGPVLQSAEGRIFKTGGGTWVVPVSALGIGVTDLHVSDGTLAFSDATVPGAGVPMAVLAKAALWLDATSNKAVFDGSGKLLRWYDAREENPAAPNGALCYGEAATTTETWPIPSVFENLSSLYFGGYSSGAWLKFMSGNASAKAFRSVRHVFLVHGVEQTLGLPFGQNGNTSRPFDYSVNQLGSAYDTRGLWYENAVENPALYGARTYVNGLFDDYFTKPISSGWQILEVRHCDLPGHMENLFNQFGYVISGVPHQGGDHVGELIVFETELSETERLMVEDYLARKWNLTRERPEIGVSVAEGARVRLDASSPAVVPQGEGTVVYADATNLALDADGKFQGAVNLPSGIIRSAATLPTAVELSGGQSVTAVGTTSGDSATVTPGSGSEIWKNGTAPLRVRTAPGVTRLHAGEGETILGGVRTPALCQLGRTAVGVMPNPSFEITTGAWDADPYSFGRLFNKNPGTRIDGWSFDYTGDCSQVFLWNGTTKASWTVPGWSASPFPNGSRVLVLQGSGAAYTTVELPEDGVYEVSFLYSGALSIPSGKTQVDAYAPRFGVYFGKTWAAAVRVGAGVAHDKDAFLRFTCRLPYATAGAYELGIRMMDDALASGANLAVDDIHVSLSDEGVADVWPIPNGDFEAFESPLLYHLCSNNVPEGWTFTYAAGQDESLDPSVAVATIETPQYRSGDDNFNALGRDFPVYAAGDRPHGRANLQFFGSRGTASVTFTPPAGTWRLRCRAANWSTLRWRNASFGASNKAPPSLWAYVDVGANDRLSLAAPVVSGHLLKEYTWPTAFTVGDGESVTLSLQQLGGVASLVVDDFVLVPAIADGNLVRDGGFETDFEAPASPWTIGQVDEFNTVMRWEYASNPGSWSPAVDEGEWRAIIRGTGAISQSVDFPAAGNYVVSLGVTDRYGFGSTRYGNNPLKVWLEKDGVRVTIADVSTANIAAFEKRRFSIRIPTAGTYAFGISGTVATGDHSTLVDSVSIIPAGNRLPEDGGIDKKMSIDVAAGATLRLDFSGTNKVASVKLGGHVVSGIVSAETAPGFIRGSGALQVLSGMIVVVR